jgi:molecular chaperone Hsp33
VSTAALGRTLMGASMMGCLLKMPEDSLTLQIIGDGPLGPMLAVSDYLGNVRGYVKHPEVELELNAAGKIDVGAGIGQGSLVVSKDMGLKDPYIGRAQLISGEIAEDITNYFAVSEQIPTVCALGVLVDNDLSVKAAGGFIIQLMPYTEDKIIDLIEKNVMLLPPVTNLLQQSCTPESLLGKALEGLEIEILQKSWIDYVCKCSKERMERAMLSLGRKELTDLVEKQEYAELVCHFCNTRYFFEKSELISLLRNTAF